MRNSRLKRSFVAVHKKYLINYLFLLSVSCLLACLPASCSPFSLSISISFPPAISLSCSRSRRVYLLRKKKQKLNETGKSINNYDWKEFCVLACLFFPPFRTILSVCMYVEIGKFYEMRNLNVFVWCHWYNHYHILFLSIIQFWSAYLMLFTQCLVVEVFLRVFGGVGR